MNKIMENELMQLTPDNIINHPLVQGAYYNFFTNTYSVSIWGITTVLTTLMVYASLYGGYELTIYIFYWMNQSEIDAEEAAWKAKQEQDKAIDDNTGGDE